MTLERCMSFCDVPDSKFYIKDTTTDTAYQMMSGSLYKVSISDSGYAHIINKLENLSLSDLMENKYNLIAIRRQ